MLAEEDDDEYIILRGRLDNIQGNILLGITYVKYVRLCEPKLPVRRLSCGITCSENWHYPNTVSVRKSEIDPVSKMTFRIQNT